LIQIKLGGCCWFFYLRGREEIPADSTEDKFVVVYLPLSYQIGGYTLIYEHRSHVQTIDMPVKDAMQMALTAGLSSGKAHAAG